MKRVTVILLAVCSSAVLFGDTRSDCLSVAQQKARVLLDKGYTFSGKARDVKGIVEGIVFSLGTCGFTEEELKGLRSLQIKIGREVEAKARNNEFLPSSYYAAEIEKRLMALGQPSETKGNAGADSPKGSKRENESDGGGPLQGTNVSFPVDGFIVKENLDLSESMSLIETQKIRTDLETLGQRVANLITVKSSYQAAFITMIVVLTAITASVVVMLFIVRSQTKRIEHLAMELRALDRSVSKI